MSEFSKPPPGMNVIPVIHRKMTPEPLVSLETPPEIDPERVPQFPFPSRSSLLDGLYTRSTHYVPAAFPRSTPDIPPVPPPKWSASKEEYKANVEQTTKALIAQRVEYLNESRGSPGSRKTLFACLSRFVRKGYEPAKGRKGLTLVIAHATGFGKEVRAVYIFIAADLMKLKPRCQNQPCSS